MGVLILDTQGTEVFREGLRLRCELPEREEQTLPGKYIYVSTVNLERVFVYGNIQFSTQALTLLMKEGIPVIFFTTDGKLKGVLESFYSRNAPVRLAQYKWVTNKELSLYISKQIIKGKLKNGFRLLQRISYNRTNFDIYDIRVEFKFLYERIGNIENINTLRGIEGRATRLYFKKLGEALGLKNFRRTKYPPRDQFNSFLSYGYTVLLGEIISILWGFGLDPYIGFYHSLRYGRPSLALDLMEEFRHPVIDTIILELWSHRIVKEEDFEEKGGRFYLKREGKEKFFELYERRMKNFRKEIRNQIQKLINTLIKNEEYKPFKLK
jgi:CRISPR-associated protein Cas1